MAVLDNTAVVVKNFRRRGSYFYAPKSVQELQSLIVGLERVKGSPDIQVVVVRYKEGYPEYAPYTEVDRNGIINAAQVLAR
jgi:hypothetical protein